MFFKFLQGFFPFVYSLLATFIEPGFVDFLGTVEVLGMLLSAILYIILYYIILYYIVYYILYIAILLYYMTWTSLTAGDIDVTDGR